MKTKIIVLASLVSRTLAIYDPDNEVPNSVDFAVTSLPENVEAVPTLLSVLPDPATLPPVDGGVLPLLPSNPDEGLTPPSPESIGENSLPPVDPAVPEDLLPPPPSSIGEDSLPPVPAILIEPPVNPLPLPSNNGTGFDPASWGPGSIVDPNMNVTLNDLENFNLSDLAVMLNTTGPEASG